MAAGFVSPLQSGCTWFSHESMSLGERNYADHLCPDTHTQTLMMADSSAASSSMNQPPKKKRAQDPPLPPDAGQKPVQLQRRRVWRACENCRYVTISRLPEMALIPPIHRRKKIKCDGVEPICSQCAGGGAACTWLQTKDRAALSRQ